MIEFRVGKERGDMRCEKKGTWRSIDRSMNPCVEPSTKMVSGDLNYTMSPLFGDLYKDDLRSFHFRSGHLIARAFLLVVRDDGASGD